VPPCEPSCLAQRKGPLEVDIPQGLWSGSCPQVEQLGKRGVMGDTLHPALGEGKEGHAQDLEGQMEQPSPVPSLHTPEQQQQLPVSRRILLAD